MNQVERFLKLGEWGCNIPVFVSNPFQCWKSDTYAFLRIRFFHTESLNVIASRESDNRSKSFSKRRFPDAFWTARVLELSGYDVVLFEDFSCEYLGFASLNLNNSGDYATQETGDGTVFARSFDDYRNFADTKIRHILRELFKAQEKAGRTLHMFFGWAKEFVGIHHSRLVFFDFSFTKSLIFSGK